MKAESTIANPLFEQRVFVTGGAGFIGSALSTRLAAEGATVLAVDRVASSTPEVSTQTGLHRMRLDLSDRQAVAQCMQAFRPQVVIHLACAPDAAEDSPQLWKSIDSNLVLAINVLEALRHIGEGLFVLGDSSKVYGNSTVPYHSRLVPDPISSYAVGKCAAWHYCRYFERLYGIHVVSVRPTLIYGPNQAFNIVSHVVNLVRRSEPVIRLDGGQQTRDPLFIDDALNAYVAVARRGRELSGRVINIGGGFEISVVELVRRIVRLMGGNSLVEADPARLRPTEILRSYCDNAEAERWIEWRPVVDLDSGLRKTIDALAAQCDRAIFRNASIDQGTR